jgi:hypothetical protein
MIFVLPSGVPRPWGVISSMITVGDVMLMKFTLLYRTFLVVLLVVTTFRGLVVAAGCLFIVRTGCSVLLVWICVPGSGYWVFFIPLR